MSSARRALAAAAYLLRLPIGSRARFARLARLVGGMLLDRQFENRSRVPVLREHLARELWRYDVVLPRQDTRMPGNQDERGLTELVSLAKAVDARTIFEIGTYNGRTALALALNLPDAVVHTLALPSDESPALPLFQSDHLNVIPFQRRAYEGRIEAERIEQHLGDSAVFDFSDFARSCDLVYINGSHSFEYVAQDTRSAFEIVSGNGVIVWDDYWRLVPDVVNFLDSFERKRLFRLPETRLVAWFSERALAAVAQGTTHAQDSALAARP